MIKGFLIHSHVNKVMLSSKFTNRFLNEVSTAVLYNSKDSGQKLRRLPFWYCLFFLNYHLFIGSAVSFGSHLASLNLSILICRNKEIGLEWEFSEKLSNFYILKNYWGPQTPFVCIGYVYLYLVVEMKTKNIKKLK